MEGRGWAQSTHLFTFTKEDTLMPRVFLDAAQDQSRALGSLQP